MRHALVLIALFSAACADTVVLGTECLTASGACERQKPLVGDGNDGSSPPPELVDAGEDAPASNLDAGLDDPPPEDTTTPEAGRTPRDAGPFPIRDARPPAVPEDAGPALFPAFINPSFELVDGGREGAINETNEGALTASATSIAPWYACRDGVSVNSTTTYGLPGRQETVTPRDGNTFITDTFPIVVRNLNGVTQELAVPLEAGKRYAFAVDVYAQPDALMLRELQLDLLWADAFGCFLGRPLATTLPIPPGSWQTRCIDFIAPVPANPLSRGVRNLMFMVTAPGDLLNFTALHFDHIRPDPMCGNAPAAMTTAP